jgi:hypothetical protein
MRLPARISCDRCEQDLDFFGKPPDGWVSLDATYHTNPGATFDVCPECIQEVKAAGGLDLRQPGP